MNGWHCQNKMGYGPIGQVLVVRVAVSGSVISPIGPENRVVRTIVPALGRERP